MSVVNINKELFKQQVEEEKKIVLAEFWAPWCVYCRRIGPAYKKIAEEYSDKLVIGQVNIDEEPELAQENNIEVVPSLILYKDGQAVGSIVAPESKGKIEEFIKEHVEI
ncbi:MAG: thioredoxin family protein [Bacillota bacterium]|nr:thioredoxin family protein [Bacillota bacterium]